MPLNIVPMISSGIAIYLNENGLNWRLIGVKGGYTFP